MVTIAYRFHTPLVAFYEIFNELNGKRNSVIIQLTVKVAFEIDPPAMMTP